MIDKLYDEFAEPKLCKELKPMIQWRECLPEHYRNMTSLEKVFPLNHGAWITTLLENKNLIYATTFRIVEFRKVVIVPQSTLIIIKLS